MKISLATARRLALYALGLDGRWTLPPGKEGAAQVIERLGYVQIDTIYIIERAHHHTLWSRYPDYRPRMLDDLLAKDRRVFEWWTHAMAYIPMRDYRFYAPRMHAHAVGAYRSKILEDNPGILDHVRDRIREEGPLGSADFKKPEGFNGGWWEWKPAKHALEALFNMGELMVTKRRNFQRIFDLTERVLPPDVDTSPPPDDELQRFVVRFALINGGILSQKEIKWSRRAVDPATLGAMVNEGEVVALDVDGLNGDTYYALRDLVESVAENPVSAPGLHILSPFDNLVIERRWLKTFFDGFDYTIECYLPAAKRTYGYFVLPILWHDEKGDARFVARLDSKADRKPKTFIVKCLRFEPDFDDVEAVLPALADKLRAFAAFNGCDNFAIENVQPEKLRAPLAKLLN